MSASLCARCLARRPFLIPSSPAVVGSAAAAGAVAAFAWAGGPGATPFHTSSAHAQIKFRNTDTSPPGGKQRQKRQPPARLSVGERKAARQRIVLSNTNALPVRDLQDLSVVDLAVAEEASGSLADGGNEPQRNSVGSMVGLDGALLEQLRDGKLFKPAQNWNLFHRPATLVRRETAELGRFVHQINNKTKSDGTATSSPPVSRQLITGASNSGRSILLLQAACMAYTSKWVVIHIPEAVDHVNNHHSYAPLDPAEENSPNRAYVQPSLTANLLSRLAYSNEEVLRALRPQTTAADSLFDLASKPPKTLADVANYGAEHTTKSWEVFTYLMSELNQPGRPPVLVSIDGIETWMGPSQYRNSDYEVIHAHQLTLVKYFLDALFVSSSSRSNTFNFPNGGLILAATSSSNTKKAVSPTFSILVDQITAFNNGIQPSNPLFPMPGPYQKLDSRVSSLFDTTTVGRSSSSGATGTGTAGPTITQLQGLSKHEARGLLEYFMKSGLLREGVTDNLVAELWALSGSGNVGNLCKFAIHGRLDPNKLLTSFGTNEGLRRGRGEHIPKNAWK